MRLFRKWTYVCQNCNHSDNKKGKWIKRRFRNPWPEGHWHIYCTKKEKFYPWDRYKRCFKREKKDKAREFREDLAYEKGLRCGNCVHYFCDEYDGDHCESDNEMMAIKCSEFVSWRDVLRLNFAFLKK